MVGIKFKYRSQEMFKFYLLAFFKHEINILVHPFGPHNLYMEQSNINEIISSMKTKYKRFYAINNPAMVMKLVSVCYCYLYLLWIFSFSYLCIEYIYDIPYTTKILLKLSFCLINLLACLFCCSSNIVFEYTKFFSAASLGKVTKINAENAGKYLWNIILLEISFILISEALV